jgi:AraC-like DNA-binding protein
MASRPNRFLWTAHVAPDPAFANRLLRHRINELVVIMGGRMLVWDRERRQRTVGPGDVILYPRGAWHQEQSDPQKPVEHICFGFTGDAGVRGTIFLNDREGILRTLARLLAGARDYPPPQFRRLSPLYMHALLAEFHRLRLAPPPNPGLEKIRSLLRERYAQDLSLDDLRAPVHMSKFHFVRTYRKWTGESPMESLRRRRVEEAKNLVITTTLPLKSIAPLTGFADEYHLSRCFKKYTGFPPGYFRKQA